MCPVAKKKKILKLTLEIWSLSELVFGDLNSLTGKDLIIRWYYRRLQWNILKWMTWGIVLWSSLFSRCEPTFWTIIRPAEIKTVRLIDPWLAARIGLWETFSWSGRRTREVPSISPISFRIIERSFSRPSSIVPIECLVWAMIDNLSMFRLLVPFAEFVLGKKF